MNTKMQSLQPPQLIQLTTLYDNDDNEIYNICIKSPDVIDGLLDVATDDERN